MRWITPLGMPVAQPYRKEKNYQIRTKLQRVTLSSQRDLPYDSARQKSAFPPNYVHSLDASHMLLTAIACEEAGIEYAAVHDSYWSHAGTIGTMNRLLRDKFVELHANDLLQRLIEDLERMHPQLKGRIPAPPPRGTLDINEVRNSEFFFH
jgi:DNA-directed RNA polymerase